MLLHTKETYSHKVHRNTTNLSWLQVHTDNSYWVFYPLKSPSRSLQGCSLSNHHPVYTQVWEYPDIGAGPCTCLCGTICCLHGPISWVSQGHSLGSQIGRCMKNCFTFREKLYWCSYCFLVFETFQQKYPYMYNVLIVKLYELFL